eukprot:scaffold241685_cov17-Tisochrysis_lutea.AAC.1
MNCFPTHTINGQQGRATVGRRRQLVCCPAAPVQAETTLALKEWAVACAALNRGDQTVSENASSHNFYRTP